MTITIKKDEQSNKIFISFLNKVFCISSLKNKKSRVEINKIIVALLESDFEEKKIIIKHPFGSIDKINDFQLKFIIESLTEIVAGINELEKHNN